MEIEKYTHRVLIEQIELVCVESVPPRDSDGFVVVIESDRRKSGFV